MHVTHAKDRKLWSHNMPAAFPPEQKSHHAGGFVWGRNSDLLEAQKELLSAAYSQAQAYTSLILGAGYAGFFAAWGFTRDQLSAPQILWSALLVTLSLMSFVLFEVYKSFYVSRALLALGRTVQDPAQFPQLLENWKAERRDADIRFGRIWAGSFWVTLPSGLGGGLILIYGFVSSLIKLYT
jgi:hypothetical protein